MTLFVVVFFACSSELSAQAKRPPREFELHAESPAFWKLVPRDSKLELVASGFGFTEGPVWDKAGFLYVSDEEINKIYRVYPDGHKEELIALSALPLCSALNRRLRPNVVQAELDETEAFMCRMATKNAGDCCVSERQSSATRKNCTNS